MPLGQAQGDKRQVDVSVVVVNDNVG